MAVPHYIRPHNGADAKDVLTPVVGDGSVVFDKEENRNDVFSETVKPRNTITHVPYRGNEQHGVEFNTPAQDFTPYWSEQAAEDKYMSPEVTPRDVVPMKPVPVQIVNDPDLLNNRRIQFNSYTIPVNSGVYIQVASADRMRSRLIVRAGGINFAYGGIRVARTADAGDANSAMYVVPQQNSATIIDTTASDAVWVKTLATQDGLQVVISVITEYDDYEGRPLL